MISRRYFSVLACQLFNVSKLAGNLEPGLPVPKSSAYASKEVDPPLYIRRARSLMAKPMDSNFRESYVPLYSGPAAKHVSLLKRATLGGSAVGLYVAYLMHGSPNFSNELLALVGVLSVLPVPIAQYFTGGYVVSISRLIDKNLVPQTKENLTKDETLVVKRWAFGGKRLVNELVRLDAVKLVKSWFGATYWKYTDPNGIVKKYFVYDNTGGIKMERIWGIIEKQSGVDNGRSDLG